MQLPIFFFFFFFFFFCTGMCDPIVCSLLGVGIPSQNSGYKVTRLSPSITLVCYFVPPPSFLPSRHSRFNIYSYPITCFTSDYATAAAALVLSPSKSRPACYHYRRDTLTPGLQTDHSQRYRIVSVAIQQLPIQRNARVLSYQFHSTSFTQTL